MCMESMENTLGVIKANEIRSYFIMIKDSMYYYCPEECKQQIDSLNVQKMESK